jgi:hypothetical protein
MEDTKDTQEVENAGGETEEIRDPKAVLEALNRAKTDAKTYREKLEAKETEAQELSSRIAALEGDEGVALWKGRLISVSAKQALKEQGVKDANRIFELLDSETLGLDEQGNLTGLDQAVSDLKKKLPELFDTKRRVGGNADAFSKEPAKQSKTPTDIQLERLRSKR